MPVTEAEIETDELPAIPVEELRRAAELRGMTLQAYIAELYDFPKFDPPPKGGTGKDLLAHLRAKNLIRPRPDWPPTEVMAKRLRDQSNGRIIDES